MSKKPSQTPKPNAQSKKTTSKKNDELDNEHCSPIFTAYHVKPSCLWSHLDKYVPDNSCSYRRNAHEKAKSNGEIEIYLRYLKRDHEDKKIKSFKTWLRPDKHKKSFPYDYEEVKEIPDDNKWSPEYPGNFIESWIVPYWHNAHHLIPYKTLNKHIGALKDDEPLIIKKALLNAQYNLNDQINMIILPQEYIPARLLKLPRHLILKKGENLTEWGEGRSHRKYDEQVKKSYAFALIASVDKELKKVIDEFRNQQKSKAEGEHVDVKAEAQATKLNDLSMSIYKAITTGVEQKLFKPGTALADIDFSKAMAAPPN